MKNTVFPHKFWRPFLDCMPQLFFRPQYVWFPVHLKGHLIPLCYETLVVNWQNWLFTLFHQSRSVLSPNPIGLLSSQRQNFCIYWDFRSPLNHQKCLYGMLFCVSKPQSLFSVYHSSPSSHVRSSLIGWLFIIGYTDCNTVPTWWM